jgi:hypothetical protein
MLFGAPGTFGDPFTQNDNSFMGFFYRRVVGMRSVI